MTEACGDNKTTQWYLKGTEPTEICPIHSSTSSSTMAINRLEREMMKTGLKLDFEFERQPLKLNLDFLDGDYSFESSSDSLEEEIDDMEANLVDTNIDYDYNYLMD